MTAGYVIKPLSSDYEAFMWKLLYDNIFVARESKTADRELEDLPTLKKYIENWGKLRGDLGYVAIDQNNQPIGAVWTRMFNEDDETWGYVDEQTPELNIATIETFRSKGAGSALLREMIDLLKAYQHSAVSLSVHPDNRCISLYKRFGFVVYKAYKNAVTMKKELNK